jgi:hypothetical protein
MTGLSALVVRASMWAPHRRWRHVERLTRDPGRAQLDVLRAILAANRQSRFGVEHGFDRIADSSAWQRQVPVQTYETLRPYIDEQRRLGTPALTSEAPQFYAQTSGTTGQPKYIPITPSMLAMQRDEQRLFSYLQFRACPEAFAGKALGIMGAAVEGHLDTGQAVGSVSGHLYESLPALVRSRFVVPPEVLAIDDYQRKYLVILRLALAEPDVTYMGSPNPSTFLRLLEVLEAWRGPLLEALAGGTTDGLGADDPSIVRALGGRLRADPARARALQRQRRLTFASVWPQLRLVTTWTGGSCGVALAAVRDTLPPGAKVMELGYQSSECRGTIALAPETPEGLPPFHHHYFEFVEAGAWDRGAPDVVGLADLEQGKRYYVLFTTVAGLYRYFINDLVEVCGFLHRTPLLRFVQKGKGVTSLTGEKLYEAQTIQAVTEVCTHHRLAPRFFVMVADEHASSYTLFVEAPESRSADREAVGAAVDRRLGELNIEYAAKRGSGRLGALSVAWLKPGTAESYKAAAVRAGQREVQFKPPVLQYRKDLTVGLEEHVDR